MAKVTHAPADPGSRVRALAADPSRRSLTSRLRDVFDDVEFALRAGVSRTDILAELCASGLVMEFKTFENALERIRAQRRRNAAKFAFRDSVSTNKPDNPAALSTTLQRTSTQPESTHSPSQPAISSTEKDRDTRSSTQQPAGSHDPQSLNDIMRNKPDLEALARAVRSKRKSELK